MSNYKIQRGDTLWGLSKKFNTSVSELMKLNPQINNASLIYTGNTIRVPGSKDEFVSGPGRRSTDSTGQKAKPPASGGTTASAASHKPKPSHKPSGGTTKPSGSQPKPPTGKPNDDAKFHSKGHGQLKGSDTSHYQSQSTFENAIRGTQFAAIKATEGTGYVDPAFKKRWAELGQKIDKGQMKLRVAYLFLDKGNGEAQAKHFLNTLGIKGPLKPGTRLALDWEASALQSPSTLRDAANYIHKVTGIWPLVYTSASQVSRARAAVPNAPMWEAKWSSSIAKDAPFVQYSDGPGYDHDVFNGSLQDLERFAGWTK